MEHKITIDRISLLMWIASRRNTPTAKILSRFTGCDEKIYTENKIIKLYQNAISDISRKYHLPGLFFNYFETLNQYKYMNEMFKSHYTEIDVLEGVLFGITRDKFDDEDKERIDELKEKYVDIEEVETNEEK